jgi:hypothetical protein
MPYTNKIKTLEESYSIVEAQLSQLVKSGSTDTIKMKTLQELKSKYLDELRLMRHAQWDNDQVVDMGDDR